MNKVRLIPNAYYQLSQKIKGGVLFPSHDAYRQFLFLYCRQVLPVARTFAYCLLPDSFHVLLQIRDWTPLLRHTERIGEDVETLATDCSGYLEEKMTRFVAQYHATLAPALASEPATALPEWDCELVSGEAEVAHRLALFHLYPLYFENKQGMERWPYTSLHSLQSCRYTFLDRDTVYGWFGGREGFLRENREICVEMG